MVWTNSGAVIDHPMDNDALVAAVSAGKVKLVSESDDESEQEGQMLAKELKETKETKETRGQRRSRRKIERGEGWASLASYLEQILSVAHDNEFLQ